MQKNSFLLAALLGVTALFGAAPEVPPVTLQELRAATISQARENTLKTGKLAYQVLDEEGKVVTTMTVWLEKPSRVRINVSKAEDSFAAGWDGSEAPWGCDKENGVFPLSAEGKKLFLQDIHFFPVITPETLLKGDLIPEGKETYEGIDCNVYRTQETPDMPVKYRFFVTETTSLVCQVITEEDGIATAFSLRGYREIDGVKLPSRITISGEEGTRVFRLVSARFDVAIPEGIFTRPLSYQNCTFGPGENLPVIASRKKLNAAPKDVESQKLLVQNLETQLKTEREKMEKMEKLYALNQESAVKLRASGVHYRSWRYYSRNYYYGYNTNRSAARKLEKQNKKIGKEYRQLVKKVTDLEMKLAEAKEKLAQMTAR